MSDIEDIIRNTLSAHADDAPDDAQLLTRIHRRRRRRRLVTGVASVAGLSIAAAVLGLGWRGGGAGPAPVARTSKAASSSVLPSPSAAGPACLPQFSVNTTGKAAVGDGILASIRVGDETNIPLTLTAPADTRFVTARAVVAAPGSIPGVGPGPGLPTGAAALPQNQAAGLRLLPGQPAMLRWRPEHAGNYPVFLFATVKGCGAWSATTFDVGTQIGVIHVM